MSVVALAVSLIVAVPASAPPAWTCESNRCKAVYRDVKRFWGEPEAHCSGPCTSLAEGKTAPDNPGRVELAHFGQTAMAELTRLLEAACAGGRCAPEVQEVRNAAARLAKPAGTWELRAVSKDPRPLMEFEEPGGTAEFRTSVEKVSVGCIRQTDTLGHPVRCGVSFPVPRELGSRAEYVGDGVEGVQAVAFGSTGRIAFDPNEGLSLEGAALGIRPPPDLDQQRVEPSEQHAEERAPPPAATPREEPRLSTTVAYDHLLRTGSLVVSASVVLGAGAFAATPIHDAPYALTGATAVAGAALSLWPVMALDGCPPWRGWGPGADGALSMFLFSTGAVAAPVLGALGTWGTGALMQGSRSPGAAFGGALAGAAIGTVVALGVNFLLRDLPYEFRPLTLGLTVGFIGSGASLGYQALGGGPRP